MEGVHHEEGDEEEPQVDPEELFVVGMSLHILEINDVHRSLSKENVWSILKFLDQLREVVVTESSLKGSLCFLIDHIVQDPEFVSENGSCEVDTAVLDIVLGVAAFAILIFFSLSLIELLYYDVGEITEIWHIE